MKLKVINIDGKKSNDIELSDKIFSLTPDKYVIQSLVDWQLNHFKSRTAKTKQRNEVKGSTKKIYAQKGTGGARHSSRKAPIFVGGGVAHGPKGAVYKIKKMNKKVRKLGLFYLLSQKNKVNSLFVVEDFKDEIKKDLVLGHANSLPFEKDYFDLVISLNTLHNLHCYDMKKALSEIERVGKSNKYICVESYRNEFEKMNLLYWQVTCECFFTPEEWKWWFDLASYKGDHSFIYFE